MDEPAPPAVSQDLLLLAARTAHVAIGVSRLSDGAFVEVNDEFCRLFGHPREAVLGRSSAALGLWPRPDERARMLQLIERDGSVRNFEARYRNAAGETGDLRISARIVGDAGERYLVGFLTDVSHQHEFIEGLRLAQSRLGAVLRSTGQLVFHQDRDLRYTWVANPVLGVSESEVLGRTDEDLLGAEAAAPLVALKRRVLESGRAQRQDVWVRNPNGQRGCFDLLVEPERDAAGRVMGIVCAASDVTARVEAAGKAAVQVALSTAVEGLADAVAVFDAGGRVLAFNEALRRFHGFPDRASVPGTVAGLEGLVEIRGADGTLLAPADWPVARALRGEPVLGSDFQLRWRGAGASRLARCSVTPLLDAAGQLAGAVLVARDVTEDRTREEHLRLWADMFRQSGAAKAISDCGSGRFVAVNPAFAALHGMTEDELLGQPAASVFPPSALPDLARQLERLDHEGHVVFESRHVRRGGPDFPVRVDLTQTRDAAGRPLLRLAFVSDISAQHAHAEEIRRLNELLRQRAHEAEAGSRAKSAFLSNMSHEIRTPLNAVLGMAALVRRDPLNERQARFMGKLEDAGRHVAQLIGTLLDLSKIEADRLELVPGPLDPLQVATEVIHLAEAAAPEPRRVVLLRRAALPTGLVGDATRLRQALLNYLANARRFGGEGPIEVSVSVVEADAGSVLLRFAVQDSGPGIAPELRARLFQPFEQGDASSTRSHGGSGLGLAITLQIARLMGGDAGVDSVPGAGSTFWFTARLVRAAAGAMAPAEPAPGALVALRRQHAGARVVLADDNEVNLELARLLLEDAGLKVEAVADGEAAVEAALRETPALLVLDLHMPGLGGIAAARELRARLPRHVPIIALTADATVNTRLDSFAAGVDDFVAKPIEADRLFAAVLHWLDAAAA